jgi:hypothetical protein
VVPAPGADRALGEPELDGCAQPLCLGRDLGEARRVAAVEGREVEPARLCAQLLGDRLDPEHASSMTGGYDSQTSRSAVDGEVVEGHIARTRVTDRAPVV